VVGVVPSCGARHAVFCSGLVNPRLSFVSRPFFFPFFRHFMANRLIGHLTFSSSSPSFVARTTASFFLDPLFPASPPRCPVALGLFFSSFHVFFGHFVNEQGFPSDLFPSSVVFGSFFSLTSCLTCSFQVSVSPHLFPPPPRAVFRSLHIRDRIASSPQWIRFTLC